MRPRLALATLALVGAGCRESPTGPYTPSGPPPSGLVASLVITPPYVAMPPVSPAIGAAKDSVVATATLGVSGCVDYAASAGVADGALVVTITSSSPPTPRYCTMQASTATFRAVVRPAPRGRYDVVLRERAESPSQAPRERVVVRRSVSLP